MSATSPYTSPVAQFAAILEALDVSPDVLVEATDVPDPLSFAGLEGLSAVVRLGAAEDSKDTWRSALEERIPTDWRTLLVNGLVSDRSFEATVDGRLQRGAAALLYLLFDTATPGNFAVAITSAALWTGLRASTRNDTEPQSLEALHGSLQARNDHDGVVKSRGHRCPTSATERRGLLGVGGQRPKS